MVSPPAGKGFEVEVSAPTERRFKQVSVHCFKFRVQTLVVFRTGSGHDPLVRHLATPAENRQAPVGVAVLAVDHELSPLNEVMTVEAVDVESSVHWSLRDDGRLTTADRRKKRRISDRSVGYGRPEINE